MSVVAEDYYAIIPEWVLFGQVSAQAIRLYAVLRRLADKEDRKATPSRKKLAKLLQVTSTRTVDRALSELVKLGAVEVTHRYTDEGDPDSSEYFLPRVATDSAPGVATDSAHIEPQAVASTGLREVPLVLLSGPEATNGHPAERNGLKRRERTELKDTLVALAGWSTEHMTPVTWKKVEAAAKEAADGHYSADDLRLAGLLFHERYPEADVTPHAIIAALPSVQKWQANPPRRRRR